MSLKALQIFFLQELLPCELEKPQQMIAFYIPLIRLGNLIQVGMHGNVVLFMVTLLHGINLFFRLWSLMLNILKTCFFSIRRQLYFCNQKTLKFQACSRNLKLWEQITKKFKGTKISTKFNIFKILQKLLYMS